MAQDSATTLMTQRPSWNNLTQNITLKSQLLGLTDVFSCHTRFELLLLMHLLGDANTCLIHLFNNSSGFETYYKDNRK